MSKNEWDDDPSATRTDAESPEAKLKRFQENVLADLAALRNEFRRMRDRLMIMEERQHDLETLVTGSSNGR